MLASIRSIPLATGISSLTSTSVSSGAVPIGFGAFGTFFITGPATLADTGTAPFGKATVAEGAVASGTVALGMGTGEGTGLPGEGPDCSLTVARGSAGEVAAIAGSTPTSPNVPPETGAAKAGLGAIAGVPAEVAERRGTVWVPDGPAVAEGNVGADGGVKDTGRTGTGGAAVMGAVTEAGESAGLNGGGGGLPGLEILGGL
jgi:hypothetical protein